MSSASKCSAARDWSAVTGQFGVNYHVTDDAMLYVSLSRGYRSGGFNTGLVAHPSYKPEYRLQTNIAVFDYDYRDRQDTQTLVEGGSNVSFLSNAAKVKVKGVEVEATAQVTRGLRLNTSASYLDAKYENFASLDPNNLAGGLVNLSGNTLPQSPKYKYSIGAACEFDLRNAGSLTPRGLCLGRRGLLQPVQYKHGHPGFVRPYQRADTLAKRQLGMVGGTVWAKPDG